MHAIATLVSRVSQSARRQGGRKIRGKCDEAQCEDEEQEEEGYADEDEDEGKEKMTRRSVTRTRTKMSTGTGTTKKKQEEDNDKPIQNPCPWELGGKWKEEAHIVKPSVEGEGGGGC